MPMNLLLTLFCFAVCVADFSQLAVDALAPGPLAGGVLYFFLAVGAHRRNVLAYWVILFMPLVPLAALAGSALEVFSLTTSWTVPILALQLIAAGLAGRALWTRRTAPSPNR